MAGYAGDSIMAYNTRVRENHHPCFAAREMEVQRDKVTCSWFHSRWVAQLGIEPRCPDSQSPLSKLLEPGPFPRERIEPRSPDS